MQNTKDWNCFVREDLLLNVWHWKKPIFSKKILKVKMNLWHLQGDKINVWNYSPFTVAIIGGLTLAKVEFWFMAYYGAKWKFQLFVPWRFTISFQTRLKVTLSHMFTRIWLKRIAFQRPSRLAKPTILSCGDKAHPHVQLHVFSLLRSRLDSFLLTAL